MKEEYSKVECELTQKVRKDLIEFLYDLNTWHEVLGYVYEIVDKYNIEESLNYMIDNNILTEKQIEALNSSENLLEEIYKDYIETNYDKTEHIKESIIYTANILIAQQKRCDK